MKYVQSSFARGEIAPELYGRTDIPQYKIGLKQAKNAIVHQYGGISNRAGLRYIAPVKDHNNLPRLIPFQFKTTDTHIIELGNEYIRFLRNDAHVTEVAKAITNVTQANPGVVTAVGHGFVNGDEVVMASIGGMTELNNQRFIVAVITADTFSLKDQVTGVDINTTSFTAYDTGGSVARIYTISSPYQQADLFDIKYVQTADIVTMVHPSYPVKELRRSAIDSWALVDTVFRPTTDFPTLITTSGGADGIDSYYQVTAIDEDDNESLAGLDDTAFTITAATQGDPVVITTSGAHGFVAGDVVHIDGIVGMTELNDRRFTVANPTATTFELSGEDGSGYTAWVSGGTVNATFVFHTHTNNVTISWAAVTGAIRYRVFKKDQGVFGFVGSTEGLSFLYTTAIVPDITDSPPRLFEPFLGTDNYPSAVGFHQQRMVFGGSNNKPDTTYLSVVGDFQNFTHSIPYQEDDSFSTTLASERINDIRHYTSSVKNLLILTSGQEWSMQGTDGTNRFSITTVEQVPQTSWGSSSVRPIVVDNDVLFVTAGDHHIRSASFSFEDDHYIAQDLSLYVPHLFTGHAIVDWSYVNDPEPLFTIVKEDGKIAVLTFNKEQQVTAWSEWITDGDFTTCAAIRPNIDDHHEQVYFVVRRRINGSTVGYIERTVEREFDNVRDSFFVDSGLSLDNPVTISNVSNANPAVITAVGHGFTDGDTVDIDDIVWTAVLDDFGNNTTVDVLNDGRYYVANATSDTFTLQTLEDGSNVSGVSFPTYRSGGTVREAFLTISGLFHLKNTPVAVLADGGTVSDITVSSTGTVTLPSKASRVHIGLPYIADFETLAPEFNPQGVNQSIQGLKRKVSFVTIRLKDTRGLLIGPSSSLLIEMKQREFENIGEPTALFNGDKEIEIQSNWSLDGSVYIRQKDPLPITILAIASDVEVGETR